MQTSVFLVFPQFFFFFLNTSLNIGHENTPENCKTVQVSQGTMD